ncbi:MAG: alpha/beta fold hydrolase [Candidatus Thorarchaeota archaeon]
MTFFEFNNVKMYYEDVGKGEPIITIHGLMEDTTYWSETGVSSKLAENYRVISIDMRGHGRTIVQGEPLGFDVETMAGDFDRLADHLGIDRFHLLSHATGGMVAVRYGMNRSERLLSLILTDTGSATIPEFYLDPTKYKPPTKEETEAYVNWMLNFSIEEKMQGIRVNPGEFLFKMAEHPNNEEMWKIYEGFLRRLDPKVIMKFREVFYNDPNTKVKKLRNIKCPTLILLGEHDIVFYKPSEIMAKEIPDNRHVILDGIGHMTAIEDSKRTIEEIVTFLDIVKKTGRASF